MSIADECFKKERRKLEDLCRNLNTELRYFESYLFKAENLEDLQNLDYQSLLDKTGEIAVVVDDVPEDVDMEEEEDDDK